MVARYHVKAFTGWRSITPAIDAEYATEGEARASCALISHPLVDIIDTEARRVVACRRMAPHPMATYTEDAPFVGREDFPMTDRGFLPCVKCGALYIHTVKLARHLDTAH